MAFVSATPLVPPVRPSSLTSSLTGRSLSHPTTSYALNDTKPCTPSMMAVEFQTYSGGLDRVTIDTYNITRYLFKNRPATLYDQEKDGVVTAGLRQLFGNAYLMEEERAEFYTAESKFRCGKITAKEFARAVGKSQTYQKRFFESVSQYRFIELNFKHFLGRAPLNQVEYSKHFKIFAEGGYEAEIDSYFDEKEYDDVFGEDYMPYTRFRGTYAPINQFNRMCALEGGWAGSDKFKPLTLVSSLAANAPISAFSVADGLPAIPNSEHPSKKYDLPLASLERFRNELEIAKAKVCQLELDLQNAYEFLDTARASNNPFKAMVASMDITPVYGINYGNGAVKVFAGQYEGAPAASWGPSGVANINGPTRRPAKVVGKKEKQLERVKQLVVDLERRVSILEAERQFPALTPDVGPITAQIAVEPTPVIVEPKAVFADTVLADEVDTDADDSGVVTPKPIVIQTKREIADVGRNPGVIMKEIEEEKKEAGVDFLEGRAQSKFPGDGSEMVIGG